MLVDISDTNESVCVLKEFMIEQFLSKRLGRYQGLDKLPILEK
jgi:hypothetical protein